MSINIYAAEFCGVVPSRIGTLRIIVMEVHGVFQCKIIVNDARKITTQSTISLSSVPTLGTAIA